MDVTEGFECLGHSNWTINGWSSPFCPANFSSFSLLILGGQFLLPQRANGEKVEFTQLQKWVRPKCLENSNGNICSSLSPFCLGSYPTFSLSPFLIFPEDWLIVRKLKSPNPEGFECLSQSNWTTCILLSMLTTKFHDRLGKAHFILKMFKLGYFHFGEPISFLLVTVTWHSRNPP